MQLTAKHPVLATLLLFLTLALVTAHIACDVYDVTNHQDLSWQWVPSDAIPFANTLFILNIEPQTRLTFPRYCRGFVIAAAITLPLGAAMAWIEARTHTDVGIRIALDLVYLSAVGVTLYGWSRGGIKPAAAPSPSPWA